MDEMFLLTKKGITNHVGTKRMLCLFFFFFFFDNSIVTMGEGGLEP